jgi:hypothetical protein
MHSGIDNVHLCLQARAAGGELPEATGVRVDKVLYLVLVVTSRVETPDLNVQMCALATQELR